MRASRSLSLRITTCCVQSNEIRFCKWQIIYLKSWNKMKTIKYYRRLWQNNWLLFQVCFECGGGPTQWGKLTIARACLFRATKACCCANDDLNLILASITYGIFICTQCAGNHRSLGVHLSFVRYVTLLLYIAGGCVLWYLRCWELLGVMYWRMGIHWWL